MISGIYIYTNKINDKRYVGQSKNIQRRISDHYNRAFNENSNEYNSIFHKAIRKYGLNNFSVEIIECNIEDLNKKETDLIEKYNSTFPNGYNIQLGGKYTSTPQKLSFKEIEEITKLLKNTELGNIEIANKYNVSENTISGINTGYYWKRRLDYPIRKNNFKSKKERFCKNCKTKITIQSKSGFCQECSKMEQRKVERPEPLVLAEEVIKLGFEAVGRKYGVSGNSIKKWCKTYGMGKLKHEVAVWYENNRKGGK